MRKLSVTALTLAVGLQLAGCGSKEPTGQVAARVGRDEITVQEVQAELNGYTAPDAKTRKLAEQRALQNIIQRKLLAQAAEKAGVDKSPELAIQKAKMEDMLLVQTWRNSLVKAVPEPSNEQIQQFITQHPELFASRKVFAVDQLRLPMVNDPKLFAELKPLNTLEDIGRVLQAHGIQYSTAKGTLDVLSLDPKLVADLEQLPAAEVFVVPSGNMLVANKITDTKVVPVPTDVANKLAARYIKASQAQESVNRMFSSAVNNHPKIKVLYNKAYAPPAAPAKGAADKGAGAAAKAG
jgi:EpsD family peptidyl-prolyl cis-trans isomerase